MTCWNHRLTVALAACNGGPNVKELREILTELGVKCAVCGDTASVGEVNIDRDNNTMKIRGLECLLCEMDTKVRWPEKVRPVN